MIRCRTALRFLLLLCLCGTSVAQSSQQVNRRVAPTTGIRVTLLGTALWSWLAALDDLRNWAHP
jgi:hypothetical protein